MRIGELSQRTGVSVHTLRAWESRYQLLRPRRSAGGTRLYAALDEARVRLMRRYLEQGLATAQAAEMVASARLTISPAAGPHVPDSEAARARAELQRALDRFEETTARAVLESLLGTYAPLSVIRDVLLPYMADLGRRWQQGQADVSQEHFTTNFLQARLLAMTRGWDRGLGPRALLSCPSGEQHTLGLIAFGIALHVLGWRITYLGADTSPGALDFAARNLDPDLVVIATTMPGLLTQDTDGLQDLARHRRCAIAGRAASPALASALGAEQLPGDPVSAAFEAAARTARLPSRPAPDRRPGHKRPALSTSRAAT
jgi:MerR family transcriptional regulator, light-induced transcriptional regulator